MGAPDPMPNLLRVRRAQRRHPEDPDLRALRTSLERAVGPTVRRAVAARLLGLSQTALDRWIAAGDVPVVLTPDGRWEVPLDPLADLVEEVDEERRTGARRPLTVVLRSRRQTVPERPPPAARAVGHANAEAASLAYHRAIADRLGASMIADARTRIDRWRAEGHIHPRYADAWDALLTGPWTILVERLRANDEEAAALRQSSPFAGMLDERERRRVLASA